MRRTGRCRRFRILMITLGVTFATAITCAAQQVSFIDLTQIVPRTEFRCPALPADDASAVSTGTGKLYDCNHPANDAPALRTTLLGLDRSEYQVGDEERFEVQIENVGSAPISIPFSPNVADLQPADPGQTFKYSALNVVLWLGGDSWSESQSSASALALYGAEAHPDTVLTLQPGEWVQVAGRGKFTLSDNVLPLIRNGDAVRYANANVSVYGLETKLSATASATIAQGACLNQSQGPNVAVKVSAPQ
jgi:hypothetical protein